jgi:hypothetical protein
MKLMQRRQHAGGAPWPAVKASIPVDISTVDIFRAERFPKAGPVPWLDRPKAGKAVDSLERSGRIDSQEADYCRKWIRDGYVVAEKLIDDVLLDYVWLEYEKALEEALIVPPDEPHFEGDVVPGRALNPHFRVPAISELMEYPKLLSIVELLLGAKATPFQSISGHKASQQATHSDSIHMTTYPQGYLVACWIAFEDIQPGSGPLV